MWVAVGVAVVGAAGAAYAANQSKSAASKAAKSQKYAADAASQVQWDMYDQAREDFAPFRDPSNRAMATLLSGIYGKPMEYEDPSTQALSASEIMAENWKAIQANPGAYNLRYDILRDIRAGEDPVTRLMREGQAEGGTDLSKILPYSATAELYRDRNGQLTTVRPEKLTATYAPTESEGFKYTKERTLADLGRQLRMIGRGNSTAGMNATGRTLADLNAANESNYKNDLLNIARMAQGAAGSTTSAGMNAAGNVSNNLMTTGNTLANINLNNGATQANLWSGLGGTAANAVGNYQMGQYLNNQNIAASNAANGWGNAYTP